MTQRPAQRHAQRHARSIRNVLNNSPFPHGLTCLQENIDTATPDDVAAGRNWYQTAHDHAYALADDYNLPTYVAAGVIAATSPQVSWDHNLVIAQSLFAGERNVCLGLGESRAISIINGEDPATVLGGRKVRSFYANICDPHHYGPVTIDRHAIAVLCGLTTPECNRLYGRFLERSGAYVHAAAHYRTAARTYGLLPHQVQAISWVSHRRRTGESTDHGNF